MKYEINLDSKLRDNKEHYLEEGFYMAESLDEFDCKLRDIVGDCIGEYLWHHMHLSESNKSFCDIFCKIIHHYVDFDVFYGEKGEGGFYLDEENKELLKF